MRTGFGAGQHIIKLLSATTEQDQVITLISGGGSALVPAPAPGLTLADKAVVNQLLLASGLDIMQMNLVRQQISQLKGGGFARHAAPAPVTAYILSDVIGDDLRAVASGPTVSPIGTRPDARRILKDAGLWDGLPASVRKHLGTADPQADTPCDVRNILIGSNRHCLDAVRALAAKSFDTRIISDQLVGDVQDAADMIVAAAHTVSGPSPTALLFGGETTVNVTGSGLGGRNQELALRVALMGQDLWPGRDWVFLRRRHRWSRRSHRSRRRVG